MKCFIFLLVFTVCQTSFAQIDRKGNGGDPHVIEYMKLSEEICKWAVQSGAAKFPQIKSCQSVVSEFRASFHSSRKAKIEFVMAPLVDNNGIAKVAIFDLRNGSVKVNRPLWQSFERKQKYVTAAIELAGLSNVNSRYDFGSFVDSQFEQAFAAIEFPKLICSFGTHAGPKSIASIQFSRADIEEYNKAIREISSDPNTSCGICSAPKRIVISEKRNPSGYQIKVDREYLIDRPFGLRVSLLNPKGQLANQSSADAYTDFIDLEYFSEGLELKCEKAN